MVKWERKYPRGVAWLLQVLLELGSECKGQHFINHRRGIEHIQSEVSFGGKTIFTPTDVQ